MKSDKFKRLLLLLNLAFAFMGVGQIWQVQLSSYPLWAYVGANELHNYHIAWWHSIWVPVFIPAGLAIMCTIALLWGRPPAVFRSSIWIAIIILFITYTLTYFWWAPLMALIDATPLESNAVFNWAPYINYFGWRNKTQQQLYNVLLVSHWLRVAFLTAYGVIIFYISYTGLNLKKN